MFLKILQWLLDLVMNSRAVQWKSPYWAKLSAYSEDREKEASQDSRQRITKTCGDNSPSLHGSTAECHQPTTREQIATILTVASAVWDWSGLCTKLWVCVSLVNISCSEVQEGNSFFTNIPTCIYVCFSIMSGHGQSACVLIETPLTKLQGTKSN